MMAFSKSSRSVGDKDALQQKLSRVPPIVLDGLISRFTEIERITNKCVYSSFELSDRILSLVTGLR